MNNINEINTLQYLGSKSRILKNICEPILSHRGIDTIIDLFAGSGSVGYALKDNYNVISNDIVVLRSKRKIFFGIELMFCCKKLAMQ